MAFFIEKIVASGAGKKESTIVFKPGANIIYGPSNTGKTYIVKCIDFLFGSDADPFDSSSGYDSISIYLKTRGGQVVMHRKLGSNKIDVSSTDPSISNGKYTAKASGKNYEKTINSVWLALIGITEQHSINKNERSQKQVLSWRTFCHMFMLTETKIISETSIFLPDRGYSDTSALSALLFLLWGKDFSDTEAIESKEIKDAKKDAIKTYINQELFKISERNQELTAFLSELSTTDINQEIESLMTQVTENEQRISEAIDENKRILQSLHEKNDALSECNVLINRYQELTTQYGADLKRLSFIVDGTANMPQISETQCPFCDGKIRIEKTPNYIEAAKSDYKKIKLQAKDLQKAYDELLAEKDILESSIESLLAKKQSAEELVANKLTPKANQLKEKIAEYKKTLEYQNEISFLKKLVEQKTSDIIDTESLGESENKFKVKDYFDYSFVSEFGKWIKLFLEDCKYPNLTSLIFDKATMDIVLNGKKKSANGKGYNAYLNSAVAIVLSRYMQKHAHYAPGLILLDSPILSLKEIDTQKPSQSMRNGLFENIASTSEGIQTIVIENKIPEIDYSNVNLIHFTKNANTGRYGFLIDVMD